MKMNIYCFLFVGMIHDHKNGKVNYSHEEKKKDHTYLYFMLI